LRRGLVVRCPSPLPRLVFQQHYFGLGRRHRSPFTVTPFQNLYVPRCGCTPHWQAAQQISGSRLLSSASAGFWSVVVQCSASTSPEASISPAFSGGRSIIPTKLHCAWCTPLPLDRQLRPDRDTSNPSGPNEALPPYRARVVTRQAWWTLCVLRIRTAPPPPLAKKTP
jgi:hypothetical protein